MSCLRVILLCEWCQRVPVGVDHCCAQLGHGQVCAACQTIIENKGALMRLPDAIEREIQQLEIAEERRGGQHACVPRLRDLRWAIEKHLRELNGEDMRPSPTKRISR